MLFSCEHCEVTLHSLVFSARDKRSSGPDHKGNEGGGPSGPALRPALDVVASLTPHTEAGMGTALTLWPWKHTLGMGHSGGRTHTRHSGREDRHTTSAATRKPCRGVGGMENGQVDPAQTQGRPRTVSLLNPLLFLLSLVCLTYTAHLYENTQPPDCT